MLKRSQKYRINCSNCSLHKNTHSVSVLKCWPVDITIFFERKNKESLTKHGLKIPSEVTKSCGRNIGVCILPIVLYCIIY